MSIVENFLGSVGAAVLAFCATVGRIFMFGASAVSHMVRPPFYGREVLAQIMQIGFYSLPVVGLTALFTGAALALAMPILVAVGDTIGIMGGYLVGTGRLGFNSSGYIKNTVDFLEIGDVTSGLAKAAVFGFIIALMGCYHGYNSGRGAQGVGRATINAVVSASVMILAANYVLTEAFF